MEISKEKLYMLYVEKKMTDQKIAIKYNKKVEEIRKLKKKWNININQRFLANFEEIAKMYKKFKYTQDTEDILQEYVGLPKSSDLYIPILEILKDNNPHNIEELWKLSGENYAISEKEIPYCGSIENPTLYYRINWCLYKMLKDNTIQEESEKKYIITQKGINKLNREQAIDEEISVTPIEQYKKLKEKKTPSRRTRAIKTGQEKNIPRIVDFKKINEENIDLGEFCEEMVYLRERQRVIDDGREDLLGEIIWASKEIGDGLGYDIQSVAKIGQEYEKIYIEVKGTNKSNLNKVIFTINEIMTSKKYKDIYYVYEITNAKKNNPQIEYIKGDIEENYILNAVKFEGTKKEN